MSDAELQRERIASIAGKVEAYHERLRKVEHWSLVHESLYVNKMKEIEEIKISMDKLRELLQDSRDAINSFKGSLVVWFLVVGFMSQLFGAFLISKIVR